MGFIENTKNISSYSERGSFFTSLGFNKIVSTVQPGPTFLCPGVQYNVGIKFRISSAYEEKDLTVVTCAGDLHSDNYTPWKIKEKLFSINDFSYSQQSSDGKVIYYRSPLVDDPATRINVIFAEMEDGDWGIIIDTKLYTKTGSQTIDDPAVDAFPNGEFTAVKMRNPETGVNFASLYRMLSAPCFTPAGMYVDFGGTPMRAATVQTAGDADAKICFAFPVADED